MTSGMATGATSQELASDPSSLLRPYSSTHARSLSAHAHSGSLLPLHPDLRPLAQAIKQKQSAMAASHASYYGNPRLHCPHESQNALTGI